MWTDISPFDDERTSELFFGFVHLCNYGHLNAHLISLEGILSSLKLITSYVSIVTEYKFYV